MFKSTLAAVALIVAATGITGAQTAETQPRSVLTEDATEKRRGIAMESASKKTEQVILGRISVYERELQAATANLERQLTHASSLRQQGLERNDQKMLKQAELLEKHAMAQYERSIHHFDQRSAQLEKNTQNLSSQTSQKAQHYNEQLKKRYAPPSPQPNPNARRGAPRPLQRVQSRPLQRVQPRPLQRVQPRPQPTVQPRPQQRSQSVIKSTRRQQQPKQPRRSLFFRRR